MNKIILIGNLTRDPEVSETPSGVTYCRLSIAVARPFANASGERGTDFFNITVWRTQAENCAQYLRKGSKAAIVGSLQNRTYDDKEGNKRTVTDVVANDVEFLSPKLIAEVGTSQGAPKAAKKEFKQQQMDGLMPMENDGTLPF